MNNQLVIVSPDGQVQYASNKEIKDSNNRDIESQEIVSEYIDQGIIIDIDRQLIKKKSFIVKIICLTDLFMQCAYLYKNNNDLTFQLGSIIVIIIGYLSTIFSNPNTFLIYLFYQYLNSFTIFLFSLCSMTIIIDYNYSQKLLNYSDYENQISIINNPLFIMYCFIENLFQLFIIVYLQSYYSLLKKITINLR